ncbi:bifunctional homocysteine S-methyltransferase/methylenetetrahydrofolate reductase [Alicyclobacillus cellulosilyticus]|uniref:Bifunctional homocysteine S-methyltransferase/methylenetetrahydrofolate reductase n=1 Tax=Alicyclobacillus cellulosilyticus TaxID=1003997 RepID=A0A917KGK7_9BACL|nr:bifunctional homocysteine S-methyltransferase/methylenetetrahydrofolate reductase [Alicyclobacillus cellulosilyticus]GGJ12913.1 bifunctional homocysteine S-methyltransferase/methylenetetrahydrofolate reductase [Alicyclobacillus cellulosilyticus]
MHDPFTHRDIRTDAQTRILVADGAMATLLHQSGVPVRTCYEALSETHPEWVERIHRAYIRAGADIIQTNTFSAHRPGLDRYGLGDRVAEVNRAAVAAARRAAEAEGRQVYVLGTIGSIRGLSSDARPLGERRRRRLADEFAVQAEALLHAGVDGLLLETFAELEEALIALRAVRRLTELPVICHLSPDTVGVTRDGVPVGAAFTALREAGADITGLNCRLGPSGILRTYEGLAPLAGGVFSAMPNAGTLHWVDGDYSFTGTVEYFAEVAASLCRLGVRVIGGCCGTTPEHIRQVREAIRRLESEGKQTSAEVAVRKEETIPIYAGEADARRGREPSAAAGVPDRVPPGHKETIVDMVKRRVTVIVELDPPKTLDCRKFLRGAAALHEAGADFITLADNSLATVRVSNMALASILKQMGIEPLVHVTCRDRNLIGQQSHLMGLDVLGIRHILLVTGDPSRFGDLPGATSVYDVSSTELTKMVKRLNAGIAFSGQPMQQGSRFVVGTSFNPHVANFEKAVARLRRKVEAGADFVMTQPMFDPAMFARIAGATADLGVPVFVGIMPLVSERNAKFLHNEVPGIQIPDAILRRMSGTTPEQGVAEGLAIARELIDEALRYFRGIYLITPFLRYELTAELTRYVRERQAAGIASETA